MQVQVQVQGEDQGVVDPVVVEPGQRDSLRAPVAGAAGRPVRG